MLEELNNNQEYNPRQRGNGGNGYGGDGHNGFGNGNGNSYFGGYYNGDGDGDGFGDGDIDGYESDPYPLDAVDLLIRLAAQHAVKPTGETK